MFPRVKDIIIVYDKGGIEGVKLYLTQDGMEIDPSTWCGNIKKEIENNHIVSVVTKIELIKEKFNFYKDVSKKDS